MEGLKGFAGALLAVLCAVPAAQEAGPFLDAEAAARLAVELGALEQGVAPDVVGQRLLAVAPDPAPILFTALGLLELSLAEGVLPLGEREHAALLDAARRLGRPAFSRLWTEAAASADPARRRTAIELVGLCGTSPDMQVALAAVAPVADGASDPAAQRLLEGACVQVLAREPQSLSEFRPWILHAAPDVASLLIRGVARAPHEEMLTFLTDLLSFDERLDLPLLSEVARLVRAQEPPFDDALRGRVRSYLTAEDRQLVRLALMTVAEMEDEDALPALLELCAVSDATLAEAAFRALERTTGLTLAHRPERWRSWFQNEQLWLTEEGARIASILERGDVPRILGALRELAAHRVARQRFAQLAAPLLRHDDPRVRLQACRTLGALATRASRDVLERALTDSDAEVVAAAQLALRAFAPGA